MAQHLQAILHCYGITTPPPNNTPPRKILEKVIGKVSQLVILCNNIIPFYLDQTSFVGSSRGSHEQAVNFKASISGAVGEYVTYILANLCYDNL